MSRQIVVAAAARGRGRPLILATVLATLWLSAAATTATGQILGAPESDPGRRYGEPTVKRFRVGAEVEASRGACRDVLAIVAIPWQCAEQDVRVLNEDVTPEVRQVDYRELDSGDVRQMLIRIPYLAAGAKARAVVSFEVSVRPVLPPVDTHELKIPQRPGADVRRYLGDSPYIESRNRKVRSQAAEILEEVGPDASAWQQVEAIYDYVRSQVEYVEGRPDQSAVATLDEGKGDCHAITVAFVALCRASRIPARMVWVEDHCYPEFYLEDAEGEGHWFPCQSAGDRAFGEMPDTRVIFQKGDNFRLPERPRDRLRYATDWARGLPVPGGGKPKVRFIREPL